MEGRNRSGTTATLGSGIVLPLIVMLPATPAHDGVRLYRASFFFLAMLAAAFCHAGWNSILKLNLAPFTALVLINIASAIVVAPFVIMVPFPISEFARPGCRTSREDHFCGNLRRVHRS